jgi:CRP/FNR family transcriptional regulator, cyclic AMP receptor protein
MDGDHNNRAPLAVNGTSPLDFLRSVPIFSDIQSDTDLQQLGAGLEQLSFPVGHTIVQQGEVGQQIYILVTGKVKVHSADLLLAELESGACFGEMSVFDAQPRSASVTTLEETTCLVLSREQIQRIIQRNPSVAIALLRVLATRTRRLTRLFTAIEDFPFQVQKTL